MRAPTSFLIVLGLLGCGHEPALPAADPADDPDATTSAPDAAVPVAPPYPDPDWSTAAPEDAGLDRAALDHAAAYAEEIGSQCLLVIRGGALVYERYWNGASERSVQKSWSLAKSFTSALVGIAIGEGAIDSIDQPVADFVPAWRGTSREAIAIRHLLSADSGLAHDLVADNVFTVYTADHTAAALALEATDPPETRWSYSNRAVQVLEAVLRAAVGMDVEDYAAETLWAPIGMNTTGARETRTHWEHDGAGHTTTYQSVYASCRDLARFGYLYLHRGRWGERQVIPTEHVAASLQPSQPLNGIYGYLWWINGGAPAIGSTMNQFEGTMFPFAPPDLFSAQGLGQSFIDVVPSTATIYVHVRPSPHEPMTRLLIDPIGAVDALTRDGERREHGELLGRLLAAD